METSPTKTTVGLNASSFLFHNGFDHSTQISDIEMITIQSVTYTSLQDLLSVSPPAVSSPTHNCSSYEIPIKNPLVKQAALSYLQPMSSPLEVGDKGFFGKMREICCIGWLNDVVFRCLKEAFWERREEFGDDEDKVD